MSVQETVTNATASLYGSKAAVFIAVVALAALALGAEPVLRELDVGVPWRQLMAGRNLQALTLSVRFCYSMAASYITASWGNSSRDRPRGGLLQRPFPPSWLVARNRRL